MLNFVERILNSPYYLRTLIFAGKYAALLQLILGFFFCGLARFGGLLGSLQFAEWSVQSALSTLMITLLISFGFEKTQEMKDDV